MEMSLLLQLFIPAMGIALSPVLIIAVVMVLGTKKLSHALVFLFGWIVGLLLLAGIALLAFDVLYNFFSQMSLLVDILRIVFGVLLFFLAAKKWSKRPKAGQVAKTPSWMSKIDSLSFQGFLSLGLAISGANPKNMAFTLAAIASIAEYTQIVSDQIVLLITFVLLSSLSVLSFVILSLALGDRVTSLLITVKTAMEQYNAVIMTILFGLFGVLLLKEGLSGLLY